MNSETNYYELACATAFSHLPPGSGIRRRVLEADVSVRVSSVDTGGRYCVIEVGLPSGASVPIHSHPHWEVFFVISGRPVFRTVENGGVREAPSEPGSIVTVASQAFHGFANPKKEPARVLGFCAAGLDRFVLEAGKPYENGASGHSNTDLAAELDHVVRIGRRYGFVIY